MRPRSLNHTRVSYDGENKSCKISIFYYLGNVKIMCLVEDSTVERYSMRESKSKPNYSPLQNTSFYFQLSDSGISHIVLVHSSKCFWKRF